VSLHRKHHPRAPWTALRQHVAGRNPRHRRMRFPRWRRRPRNSRFCS